MKEIYQGTPFRQLLRPVPDDGNQHLYTLDGNPNYVVRQNRIIVSEGVPQLNKIDIAEALFEELERDYGIHVVPFDTVVGLGEDNLTSAFMIVDKVKGAELPKAQVSEQEAKEFFSNLLRYHIDKFEQGGFFLCDLNPDDFMYGNTEKDTTKKVYLVDLDQFYEFFDDLNPNQKNEYFSTNLEGLNDILNTLEKNSKSDLGGLREDYLAFLRRIRNLLHPADQETIDSILENNRKLTTEDMGVGLQEPRF
ncbi:MAG: hypothetical protein A2958_00235 [Candidatus Levybacteria bacterium RIFCSPLOWO2_01_FULL_38_13]|nr:MAG: hypothetical protein A2629_02320 [Candidatus Levybacteria bacterium RIFCSPHIGHO2_01_FULL_41_15]OGH34965.1 MAG: hypothetical protein A2958_00235 [Candidatus Levybacteria bacterium RIFCSPLOWO2_01_FULL_38_13]